MTLPPPTLYPTHSSLFRSRSETSWQFSKLFLPPILIILSLLFWFSQTGNDILGAIDYSVYKLLNHSLLDSPNAQYFWGYLNHRKEVWLNLILTIGLNVFLVITAPKAKRLILYVQYLYFWTVFEIGLFIQDHIIFHFLEIRRPSPSLVFTPWVKLSEVLNNPSIVDASPHAFPSGHAFAMLYWAMFTSYCSPKLRTPVIGCALFFCLPRLVSGAHWTTDMLFSGLLALMLFSLAIATPVYQWLVNHVSYLHYQLGQRLFSAYAKP